MPARRRKARHRMNPLGWLPPETVALIAKAVGAGLVVAFPALAVRQEGQARQQSANEATNAALGAAATLSLRLDTLEARSVTLERQVRSLRANRWPVEPPDPPAPPADKPGPFSRFLNRLRGR